MWTVTESDWLGYSRTDGVGVVLVTQLRPEHAASLRAALARPEPATPTCDHCDAPAIESVLDHVCGARIDYCPEHAPDPTTTAHESWCALHTDPERGECDCRDEPFEPPLPKAVRIADVGLSDEQIEAAVEQGNRDRFGGPAEPSREEPADLEPIRAILREVADGGWQNADGVPIPPASARAALATLEPAEPSREEPRDKGGTEAILQDMERSGGCWREYAAHFRREREELERALEAEERCAQESGGILSDVCDIAFGDYDRAAVHGYHGILERVREMVTEREELVATLRELRDEASAYARKDGVAAIMWNGSALAYTRVLQLLGVDE